MADVADFLQQLWLDHLSHRQQVALSQVPDISIQSDNACSPISPKSAHPSAITRQRLLANWKQQDLLLEKLQRQQRRQLQHQQHKQQLHSLKNRSVIHQKSRWESIPPSALHSPNKPLYRQLYTSSSPLQASVDTTAIAESSSSPSSSPPIPPCRRQDCQSPVRIIKYYKNNFNQIDDNLRCCGMLRSIRLPPLPLQPPPPSTRGERTFHSCQTTATNSSSLDKTMHYRESTFTLMQKQRDASLSPLKRPVRRRSGDFFQDIIRKLEIHCLEDDDDDEDNHSGASPNNSISSSSSSSSNSMLLLAGEQPDEETGPEDKLSFLDLDSDNYSSSTCSSTASFSNNEEADQSFLFNSEPPSYTHPSYIYHGTVSI